MFIMYTTVSHLYILFLSGTYTLLVCTPIKFDFFLLKKKCLLTRGMRIMAYRPNLLAVLQIKFYWKEVILIYFHTVSGCFHTQLFIFATEATKPTVFTV